MMEDEYEREQVGPGRPIRWEDGKPITVAGRYLGSVEQNDDSGTYNRHDMLTLDGEKISFSAPAMLEGRLQEIVKGELIEIIYPAETVQSRSGRSVKMFRVNRLRLKGAAAPKPEMELAATPGATGEPGVLGEDDVPF